jgi:hypothetical protein
MLGVFWGEFVRREPQRDDPIKYQCEQRQHQDPSEHGMQGP